MKLRDYGPFVEHLTFHLVTKHKDLETLVVIALRDDKQKTVASIAIDKDQAKELIAGLQEMIEEMEKEN